ncbi:molybdate ABC transporter substrate-binding protein [Falsirhodobacter sp. 20TX0035]|uniref:molybdate ABC transporter substrate-binding protein n=1 Tax=Falsirhodobacter sp. 20TX0035 TaxID=3022019 RepID=UPI00232F5EA5|nr:molybdate ABC transporter substrate-binding protein [Falsirhodobacter sp. 20TX0035]MDB6453300.1 molybdate ABC transporter substrate-binding protein [Falsirhodobacter sp. 20TX0035]
MLRLTLVAFLALSTAAHADTVTVFAAASLKTALDQIAAEWQPESGDSVTVSYAGSSTLAKQIVAGAPANLFISASTDWMEAVETEGLVAGASREDLLGNTLVAIGPKGSAPITAEELPETLGESYLAMAMVDSVPAGVYGKQALTHLGLWEALAPRVAQTDDVRAALALVAAGEAHMGIVYASDAKAEPRVDAVLTFPSGSHDPITYPAALIKGHDTPAAEAFLKHLSSDEAAAVFRAQGFDVLR